MASPAAAQLELIQKLEDDGILTPDAATLARERYVAASASDPASRSASLFTMSNCAKAFGVLTLLMALVVLVGLLTPWLTKAPIELYQVPMLAVALATTLRPRAIWPAQAPYVALLATFSTLIIAAWIIGSHDAVTEWLDARDRAGWPVTALLASTAMTFFASTALLHHSPALAIAAAICFTTAFVDSAGDGTLPRIVTGHLFAVAAHIVIKARGSHPKPTYLFTYAVEYYGVTVLAATLWIGTFAWDRPGAASLYTALFAAVLAAAGAVYYRLAIKTPASILTCFAALVMLTWLQYWAESAGTVVALLACGAALFGYGLLLERHRHWLVFERPREPGDGGAAGLLGDGSAAVGMPMLGEGPDVVALGPERPEEG